MTSEVMDSPFVPQKYSRREVLHGETDALDVGDDKK
jgi:hypothetical protein